MMPTRDPHRELHRQLLISAGITLFLIALASWWAMPDSAELHAPAFPRSSGVPLVPPTLDAALSPAMWNVALWRPLSDAPIVIPLASPPSFKLFSILKQGDALIAALDPGDGNTLVYVHAGDQFKGATIVAIDERGVSVQLGEDLQRFELVP
jgi:hypothetical protein